MAIVQMGTIVTKISGKVGGQTFLNSHYGPVIRNTGSYAKSSSLIKKNILSSKQVLQQIWATLSDAERLTWNTLNVNFPYVNRLGESRTYSGYNLFCRFNGNLLLLGNALNFTCQMPQSFADLDNMDITSTSGGIYKPPVTGGQTNTNYALFCSRPLGKGQVSTSCSYRYIRKFTSPQMLQDIEFSDDYTAVYGYMPVGSCINWYLKAIKIDTGQCIDKLNVGRVEIVN